MRTVFVAAVLCLSTSFGADLQTNAPSAPVRPPHEAVSEEQRGKLRESNEKFRAVQSGLYEKLRSSRKEMEQAAQADPISEQVIRAKAANLGQIEGDLAILRARHYQELRSILPHDQAARQSGLSTSTNPYSPRFQSGVRRETNSPAGPIKIKKVD